MPDKLPSHEDLTELPRRAVVAFAARCARRVLPLYQGPRVKAVVRAVEIAEADAQAHPIASAAAAAAADPADPDVVDPVYAAAESAAEDAAAAAKETVDDVLTDAAYAAARSACAAARSTLFKREAGALRAASDAAQAANHIGNISEIRHAMRRDFDLFAAAAQAENWIDTTPVPPESVGPLWPDGPPEGWPEGEQGDPELVMDLDVPEGVSDEAVAERVRQLLAALDEHHRSLGGGGLEIRSIDAFCSAGVPAGAPS